MKVRPYFAMQIYKHCIKLLNTADFHPPDWIQRKKNTLYIFFFQEITEKIELQVGTPQKSEVENVPIWATPENLPFFKDENFPLFSYSYWSNVPKWKCAHILLCKKYKNCLKLLKIAYLQPPDWIQRKKTPCTKIVTRGPQPPLPPSQSRGPPPRCRPTRRWSRWSPRPGTWRSLSNDHWWLPSHCHWSPEGDAAGEGDQAAVGVLEAVHGLPGLGLGAQLAWLLLKQGRSLGLRI